MLFDVKSIPLLCGEQAVENQEQKQEGQGQNDSVTSHFTPGSIVRADIQTRSCRV